VGFLFLVWSPGFLQAEPLPTEPAKLSNTIKKILSRLRSRGIVILPDALTALQSKTKTVSAAAASQEEFPVAGAVEGTPPALASFDRGFGSVKNIFWRPGVVDAVASGSPTAEQCAEFFNGPVDGQSGGIGACRMAEGIGRAFETSIDATATFCKMQNFPNQAFLDSGRVVFKRGKKLLPNGDFTKIFTPGTKNRFIKVRSTGESPGPGGQVDAFRDIFVRVFSTDENEKRKLLYRAEIYTCRPDAATAEGLNIIEVNQKGVLRIVSKDTGGRSGNESIGELFGRMKIVGSRLQWDLDQPRSGTVRSVIGQTGRESNEYIGF